MPALLTTAQTLAQSLLKWGPEREVEMQVRCLRSSDIQSSQMHVHA